MADTMRLVSAYKVEQDLERTWREERFQSEVEQISEQARVKPKI
jgi:hypothetical protein